ncbi:lipid asymmetry maintenance protein MlaB [Thioalkalivibrio sp. ALJ24]|uniref:STAS domain-containing protein n=1 Tax=Thioalkalivibrio sp. ALJ24 TaxID=545276 RepID=UPI000368FC4F|nr:STAS domain-containing protein [Thioalkalivibrio sp. ALJ24]
MSTHDHPAIELPERLRIDAVEALTEQARETLDRGAALRLDANSVQDVDTAGLQLLAMLRREARRRKQPMHIEYPTPALEEGLQRLGLHALVMEDHGGTAA